MTGGKVAPRRRNPRGQGQALRAELVDAAARLLATLDRPETLTLRQVAREVGVAPASIYSHFPDLDALIRHVLRMRHDELGRLMDDAAARTAEPLAELVARCAAYARWGVGHPGEYRTLFGGGMPPEQVPIDSHGAGDTLLAPVIGALTRVERQAGAPADADREWQAGLLLWTALHGLVSLYDGQGALPWPRLDSLIVDVLHLHTARPAAEIEPLLPAGT